MESILNSVKTGVGIVEQHNFYDSTIVPLINSNFSILNDMGVGPEEPFHIDNEESNWSEFTSDEKIQRMVREWMVLKVRLAFDPPASGTIVDLLKETVTELETRMYYHCDLKEVKRGETNGI